MSNNKDIKIVGSGGGKGGKTPVEAPNTLQSRSTIKLVEVLSEGPVGGIIGDLKGVYFDNTPVQNSDDSFNFPAVKFDQRFGLWDGYDPAEPAQEYIPGFSDGTESPSAVNTEITSSGITRNINTNIDAVRIVVRLPNGLSKLEDSGDLNGYRVGISIETRLLPSGTFSVVKSKTITGKTLTAYEEAYRIERPDIGGTGEWQIRVRRTTAPSTSARIVDRIDWNSYTEIRDIKVTYDGAAVVGVAIDAESTGGKVPVRSYLVEGRLVDIPHNYTPRTYNADGTVATNASYSGAFNGSMVASTVATDNPAWIIYDLLTNDRYGMGDLIDPSTIDIYSFYDAAVYNDELIDNGQGGTEPRFRFNGVLQTREDAFKTIQAVSASMRASVFAGNGLVRLIQDRPTDVSAYITNANVIDGKFTYVNSELTARPTACTVTYNDRLDNYNPKTVIEEASPAAITRYGYNKIELGVMGCVYEAQARRMAKWAIDASFREDVAVSFKVSWQNAFIEVGDVVSVADNFIANYQIGGTISGGTTTTIVLDRAVTITTSNTIRYIRWDGTEAVRNVLNAPGTYTTLNLSGTEDVTPFIGSAWGLYSAAVPRMFKINAVKEDSVGIYEVNAVSYDPSSYDRIESGIIVDEPIFGVIDGYTLPAPTGLVIEPETVLDPNGSVRYRLRLDWDDVTDTQFRNYRVRWRKDNNQYQWSGDILQSEYILENILPGVYEFSVYAYSTRGTQSPGVSDFYTLAVAENPSVLNAPTALQLSTGGTTFTGLAFTIQWTAPVVPDNQTQVTLLDYEVKIYNGASLIRTINTTETRLEITREEVIAWAGSAIRNILVEVRARDTLRNLSVAVSQTFSNPAPAAPGSIVVSSFGSLYQLSHAASAASDTQGVLIHHVVDNGSNSNFTPTAANLVKRDVGTQHLIEAAASTVYNIKLAFFDSWSEGDLNYSSSVQVTTSTDAIGITPDAPTGLTVSSAIAAGGIGQPNIARLTVTWNRVTTVATQYELQIQEGSANAYLIKVNNPSSGSTVSTTIDGIPNTLYQIRIRSITANSVSVWSAFVNHTSALDNTPPAVVPTLTAQPAYLGAVLTWSAPADLDIIDYELYRRPVGGSSSTVARLARGLTTYFDTGLVLGTTYEYNIVARDASGNLGPLRGSWTSVSPANVPTGTIGAAQIIAGSITSTQIAANTITANNIQARAITGDRIAVNTINADNLNAYAITAGFRRSKIARFDGINFTPAINNAPNITVTGGAATIFAVARDSTGRIYIGGSFTAINGVPRVGLARLTSAGALDTVWNYSVTQYGNEGAAAVYGLAVDSSDNVYAVGVFNNCGGTNVSNGVRINTGGFITDMALPNFGFCVTVADSNSIIVGGGNGSSTGTSSARTGYLRKYNSSLGTVFTTYVDNGGSSFFWTNANVYCVNYDSSTARYYYGGDFTGIASGDNTARTASSRAAYVSTGGTLTALSSLNINNGAVRAILKTNSNLWLGGTFTQAFNSTAFRHLAAVNPSTGSNNFAEPVNNSVFSLTRDPTVSDNVYVGGWFTEVANGTRQGFFAKISDSFLQFDVTFDLRIPNFVFATIMSGTSLWVAGSFQAVGGTIQGSQITGDQIIAGTIDANRLVANSIVAGNLAAGSVTIDKIASDLRSDNYVSGVSGWRILKSGQVELATADIRGRVRTGAEGDTGFRCEIGGDPDYVIWAGSGTKNDSNGVFFVKTDGTVRVRGSLSAGAISSSIQNTSTLASAQVTSNNTVSNGNPVTVVMSYLYELDVRDSANNYSYTGSAPSATCSLEWSVNGGSSWSTDLSGQVFTGTATVDIENEPGLFGGYSAFINGAVTRTRTVGVTTQMRWRATMNRSIGTFTPIPRPPGGTTLPATQNARLSITTSED